MKIYFKVTILLVFLGLLAGGVLGAELQGKDLTIPSIEGVKLLEGGQIPKEKLYSLTVRDADLKEVLFAFSKDNGINIIVDPDVFGKVTVDLKKVTMAAALEALLKPLNLDYQQEGNLIRVTRPKMETRTFILNYLTTVRKGSGSVSGIGGSSAAGPKAGGGSILSQVITEDHADLWEEIKEGLKNIITKKMGKRVLKRESEILSKETEKAAGGEKTGASYVEEIEAEGDGKILINKMAGMVIVTDYPSRLREVEKFLTRVEETVQRQVFIEAKIIEVVLNDNFQLGIDWRFIPNLMNMGGIGGFVRQSLTGTADFPANNKFQLGVGNADFNALIDALSTQGKVEVLSSPRVSTLNNQKAIIKAAVEDVYFDVEITQETGQADRYKASPKYITIGVILDVTPQIDSDGTIIMDIHPSVTERIRTASFSQTGQQAPIISVRETQTIVRVREGQTILIAGLMQSKEKEELTGLPCLMNIPVAGEAFRQTRRDKTKSEIVILITPTLYTGRKIIDFTKQGNQTIEGYRSQPTPGRHDLIR